MIALDDIVLKDDLDPRLGQRDDDLIAQYAEIFDQLPPIEINQNKVLIDGWHRVRAAKRAKRVEIAYVVVETADDDDLSDRMWAANLKHGVQYSRAQRQTQGLKLHGRGLKAKEIAERVGVSASSVYSWTKALREQEKQERDTEIARLRDEGKTLQEIGEELDIDLSTAARNLQNSKTGNLQKEAEREAEPEIVADEPDTGAAPDADLEEIAQLEPVPAESEVEEPESVIESPMTEPDTDEAPSEETLESEAARVDEIPETEPELALPEPIPDAILNTARAVMGAFSETRPDDYVARLEASPGEWMTITDDSLSNELERELLTSAAAMCLWQEWMVWYQGGRTSAFTAAFGKIGTVFVRGQAGQWTIVSRLRSMLKRIWA